MRAQPKPDASITVTAGRPGPAPDAAVDAMAPLQPYPLDKLGCFGEEHDGGYYGQCCVARVCEPPVNGVCSASGPKHGLPGGSGSCSCNPFGPGSEFQGALFLGPYAPNPVDSAHASIPDK